MSTKTCNKCNIEKSIENFSKHSGTKDKLDNRCKECVKIMKNDKNKEKRPHEKDLAETNLSCTDWQGGKYAGSIFNRITEYKSHDSVVFIVSIGGKQKTFNPKNFKDEKECEEKAEEYKKEKSDELNLTSNKYKIIFEDDKPKYLIVQLSKNYVTLCDYSHLEFIKNTNLFVSKGENKNKQYCFYNENNENEVARNKRFHGYITGFDMVDHINRYPLDNRLSNLRKTTHMENNRNSINTNKTTLMTGVSHVAKDDAWRARIKIDGKEHNRQFAINTYGYEEAKQLAINWRQEKAKITKNYVSKVDENTEKHPDFDKLEKEYLEIMSKHADGFQWKD